MRWALCLIVVILLVGCGKQAPQAQSESKTGPVPTGPTSAELATLEKKHPDAFVNSLGMVFRPVLGTEVQFCIWETRVNDYAVYAVANTGVDGGWKKPGFKQADTHPVVKVTWDDAQAFCSWLTKKELAEGKLKPRQRYRLPTDAEWSVAVGLESEIGGSPKQKNMKVKEVYPWGKGPRTPDSGNYHTGKLGDIEYTESAGSYRANQYGLYDMGGNVWEWCQDLYDPAERTFKGFRVLRGASWAIAGGHVMLSSCRESNNPATRHTDYGFRCVLASE